VASGEDLLLHCGATAASGTEGRKEQVNNMRKPTTAALSAVIAAGLAVIAPSTAQSEPDHFYLRSELNDKCVDLPGGVVTPGGGVWMWPCEG
jgi:hypothetical protein